MGRGTLLRQGHFDEALVYYDEKALYFEVWGKDGGAVRFSYEMLETQKRTVENQG